MRRIWTIYLSLVLFTHISKAAGEITFQIEPVTIFCCSQSNVRKHKITKNSTPKRHRFVFERNAKQSQRDTKLPHRDIKGLKETKQSQGQLQRNAKCCSRWRCQTTTKKHKTTTETQNNAADQNIRWILLPGQNLSLFYVFS